MDTLKLRRLNYCYFIWQPSLSHTCNHMTHDPLPIKIFKEDLSPKHQPCFYVKFLLIARRKSPVQVLCRFGQTLWSCKVIEFWIQRKWRHLRLSIKHITLVFYAVFASFLVKAYHTINFFGVFYHFSRNCEVAKFWIIKLHLYLSDEWTSKIY